MIQGVIKIWVRQKIFTRTLTILDDCLDCPRVSKTKMASLAAAGIAVIIFFTPLCFFSSCVYQGFDMMQCATGLPGMVQIRL